MGDSTWNLFRNTAGKYGLGANVAAAAILVYARTEFSPWRPEATANLFVIVTTGLFAGLILSLIGLPRLEAFMGLFVFTLTAIIYTAMRV